MLITPPPIDEWAFDGWDEPGKSARKAVVAQQYAEGVRRVGADLGVAVVDLWGACMEEATAVWNASRQTERGVELLMPGDKRAERSEVLARLLYDGKSPYRIPEMDAVLTTLSSRSASER